MLINYIKRFTNRRADKGFFEITKHTLGSMDRMQNCSHQDKWVFFLIYFISYQRKEPIYRASPKQIGGVSNLECVSQLQGSVQNSNDDGLSRVKSTKSQQTYQVSAV